MARGAFLLTLAFKFFLIRNFGSRYARKPIKGCKDSDDSLVSKQIIIEKIGYLGWYLGPGKGGPKHPHRDGPPGEPQVETRRLAESVGGWNTSLALATGEFWN